MFLKKSKYKNGRTFLSIVEAFRDENGFPKQRLVQKIGYLDDLSSSFDDPIAHFSDLAKQMTIDNKQNSSVSLSIDLDAPLDPNYNLFNVGYLPFKYIYNELGLNEFFINKQRNLNIEFSLSKNLQLLVFSRILFPASKKSTFENRNSFLLLSMMAFRKILFMILLIISINIKMLFNLSFGKIRKILIIVILPKVFMIAPIIILKLNITMMTCLMIMATLFKKD